MTVPDLPESRMYTSLLTGITGSSLALCLLSWLSFMRCLYECLMSDNCSWSVSFGFSVDGSTGRSVRNRRLINSSAGEYPLWIGVLRVGRYVIDGSLTAQLENIRYGLVCYSMTLVLCTDQWIS